MEYQNLLVGLICHVKIAETICCNIVTENIIRFIWEYIYIGNNSVGQDKEKIFNTIFTENT